VYFFVWFENKVPTFAHLDIKDKKIMSCYFLHAAVTRKNIEKSL
jgi:hypothetical protein